MNRNNRNVNQIIIHCTDAFANESNANPFALTFSFAQHTGKCCKSKRECNPTKRTTQTYTTLTQKHIGQKERQPITAVWRNGGCSASYDSFMVGSSVVLRLNFCAKNPLLRQAAKRWAKFSESLQIFPRTQWIYATSIMLLFHL